MYVYRDFRTRHTCAPGKQGGAWGTPPPPVTAPSLTTFGEDVNGELYVGSQGVLYALAPPPALPPTIDAIAPASGSTRGGQGVAITGTNFTGQTTVLFGLVPSPAVDVRSATLIVA